MKKSIERSKIIPCFLWVLLSSYIFLSFVVMQVLNIGATRLAGIVMILPVLLMLAISTVYNKGMVRINYPSFFVYLFLFGFFCVSSSFWAEDPSLALSKGIDIIEVLVIMFFISISLQRWFSIDGLLKAIMFSYYAVVIYEIIAYGWTYIILVMRDSSRVSSDLINSNTLGMCAAFAVLINLYLLISKRIHLWTITLSLLSVVVIAASGSRKALISLVLGMFLFVFFRSLNKEKGISPFLRFLISLPIIGIVGYQILMLPAFSGIMERINGLLRAYTGGEIEKSAMIRSTLIKLGIDLFREHPLVGIGLDNPRLHTTFIEGFNYYLHNNYAELLAAGGIIGFVAYYWIYVKLLFLYIKRHLFCDSQYCICLVLICLTLILDYGMVTYYSKETYVFLLLFSAYGDKLKRKDKYEQVKRFVG